MTVPKAAIGTQRVLEGRIEPGRVFDHGIDLEQVLEGYRAMDAREAIQVMIDF